MSIPSASAPAAFPRDGGLLAGGDIAGILGEIRGAYGRLVRQGRLHGLMLCDADARVLALDPYFDSKISAWDLAALSAATFGVAKQARLFFGALGAKELERGSLVFDGLQMFVAQAGATASGPKTKELLLVVLADKDANFGLVTLQMKKYSAKISQIVATAAARQNLDVPEGDLQAILEGAKSGRLFK